MNHVEESRLSATLGRHALNVFDRLKNSGKSTSMNQSLASTGHNVEISRDSKNNKLYCLVISKSNDFLTEQTKGWSDEKVNGILEEFKANYISLHWLGPVNAVRKQIMDEMEIFVTTNKDGDRSVSIGIEFIDGNNTYVMLPKVVGYIESIRVGILKLLVIKFTSNYKT